MSKSSDDKSQGKSEQGDKKCSNLGLEIVLRLEANKSCHFSMGVGDWEVREWEASAWEETKVGMTGSTTARH